MTKIYRKFKAWMDYNPPMSLSSKGWRLFKDEFKKNAPIRYWIDKTVKPNLVWPFSRTYKDIQIWIRYHTYNRKHIVKTGLKPDYYDVSTQMLHVNFTLLVDFVECELSRYSYWQDEANKKELFKRKYIPFYTWFYKIRSPEHGLQHLDWARTLDDPSLPPHERNPHQAVAAREMIVLYTWWTKDRPERKEVELPDYDHQGLGWLSSMDEDFNKDADDYVKFREAITLANQQEADWEKEDQEMLLRLVKIRKELWT